MNKIKRLHRTVSRRQKGSSNRKKAVRQLAKAYARTADLRKEALQQATTRLTKTMSVIVLENLNVSGMLKNHHLAQAISDVSWSEFRRQVEYKGGVWLPSCSCGSVLPFHETLLGMRAGEDGDGLG